MTATLVAQAGAKEKGSAPLHRLRFVFGETLESLEVFSLPCDLILLMLAKLVWWSRGVLGPSPLAAAAADSRLSFTAWELT